MTDERLRELEQRWKASGSPEDEAAWLQEKSRQGVRPSTPLEIGLSKFSLGLLNGDGIVDLAHGFIDQGLCADELLELASVQEPQLSEAAPLLRSALESLQVSLPGNRPAVLCLAKEIAWDVYTKRTSPYEGARRIWSELFYLPGGDPALEAFRALASEYEDDPSETARSRYREAIEQEFLALLRDPGSPPSGQ